MSTNVRLPMLHLPPDGEEGIGMSDESNGVNGASVANGAGGTDAFRSGAADGSGDAGLKQVGDLARESGKTVRAIHLYEELGLLHPAARSKGRYRLYGADALVRIRWIGRLQEMGFSLTDIQTIVREWEELHSAPRAMIRMKETYKRKLAETREHIHRLRALEHELEASLVYLDTCEVCDPDRMLSACKACDLHTCGEHVPELIAGFRAS